MRIPNIHGGGARTNENGLKFERDTDLLKVIGSIKGYKIVGNKVLKNDILVAEYFSKRSLYDDFLNPRGINHIDYISAQLLPDDVFITGSTCYIIEKKFQSVNGSVDEKLVTFPFKMQQYQKMFSPLNIEVKFYYLLNDWFKEKGKYQDTLAYIENQGSRYFFVPNELIASLNI